MRDVHEPGPSGSYELDGGPTVLGGLLIRAWETDSADWLDGSPEPVTVTLRAYDNDGQLVAEREVSTVRRGGVLDADVNLLAQTFARRYGK